MILKVKTPKTKGIRGGNKMKKSLLVVVALLCMASLMAAMAFSTASVSNAMTVKLANTQDALLALSASEYHNAATTDHITADMLNINLNKGKDGVEYGIQPHSTYEWDDLFNIKNNSENDVDVTVKLGPNSQGRTKIFAKYGDNNWVMISGIHSDGGELTLTIPSGDSQWIDFKTDGTLNGHVEDYDFNLIVEADSAQ